MSDTQDLLIDINGLSAFKTKMDASVDSKISSMGKTTYSLSGSVANDNITLTGSDSSSVTVHTRRSLISASEPTLDVNEEWIKVL